jgi:hypothetical protein
MRKIQPKHLFVETSPQLERMQMIRGKRDEVYLFIVLFDFSLLSIAK